MYSIFEPAELGSLTAPNRFVRSATWLGLADERGAVTDALVERYAELGRGGAGVIVTGYASVSPEGRHRPRMLGVHDDSFVPGLKRLAEAIRARSSLAGLQLVHAGGQTRAEWIGGRDPVAPSFTPAAQYPEVPRELSFEEIGRIVTDFGRAARRAREAGFDFVQLHAAHGFLINQFLSPATNLRTDRYGGDDVRQRFRFLQEVWAAVQGAAGPDFPVAVKLNGADFVPGGLEPEEAARVAEWVALRGPCLIEMSGGTPGSGDLGPARRVESPKDEAYFRDFASMVKRRVSVPVAVVGGLRSVETLENLFFEGVADFFSLARPLLWEPELPARWASGDRSPARCTSCSGCFSPGREGQGVRCVARERLEHGGGGGENGGQR